MKSAIVKIRWLCVFIIIRAPLSRWCLIIESNLFLEEPGNLLSQYEVDYAENAGLVKKNKDLETWASWNRYFIFQKVNNLNE